MLPTVLDANDAGGFANFYAGKRAVRSKSASAEMPIPGQITPP